MPCSSHREKLNIYARDGKRKSCSREGDTGKEEETHKMMDLCGLKALPFVMSKSSVKWTLNIDE